MKKMKLNFNTKVVILTLMITLVIPLIAFANNAMGNIIVTPKVLEGEPGSSIQVEKALLVQEVTMTNVKLLDVQLVNDKDRVITKYPTKEGKYSIVEKETNRKVGFIDLKPSTSENEVSISFNLEGEYPYYQNGLVFNTLRNAQEGSIYFLKRKGQESRPLILHIGDISNGVFSPKDFIEIKSKVVQIKEGLK